MNGEFYCYWETKECKKAGRIKFANYCCICNEICSELREDKKLLCSLIVNSFPTRCSFGKIFRDDFIKNVKQGKIKVLTKNSSAYGGFNI